MITCLTILSILVANHDWILSIIIELVKVDKTHNVKCTNILL